MVGNIERLRSQHESHTSVSHLLCQIIWMVTALAVILTDVDSGLYLGVSFSLMTVVFRTQRHVPLKLQYITVTQVLFLYNFCCLKLEINLKLLFAAESIDQFFFAEFGPSFTHAHTHVYISKVHRIKNQESVVTIYA
jgi:hypothetical protein